MKTKTLSILMAMVILFAAFGALSPQKVTALSNSPKLAVLEFWAIGKCAGCPETGEQLEQIKEEYAGYPVAILEWQYRIFEPELRAEMITESGMPNFPATMMDSSRLFTRSWYPEHIEHYRTMIDSSMERSSRADLSATWEKRDDGLLTVRGSVKNTSDFEWNLDNKTRIQVLVYEEHEDQFNQNFSNIGRGHASRDITSLAVDASMDFEIQLWPGSDVVGICFIFPYSC